MNITDFCSVVLKAPLRSAYDWSCENDESFFYLGWNNAIDMKKRTVNVCSSLDEAISKNATKQLMDKMLRERNKLFKAIEDGKSIYYVLRVKQNPESDGDWSVIAKSKSMSNNTIVLKIDNITELESGEVTADLVERLDAKSFR